MPKKNLMISAVLTMFILVIATGVVSAYKQVNTIIASVQPADTAGTPVQIAALSPTEPVPVALLPQDAALVAANYLGQTDLYSVENTVWNGMEAYKVVFSSGDVVYVSTVGEILGTEAPQSVFITNNNGGNNNNNAPRQSSHGEHEEHEEHDDD